MAQNGSFSPLIFSITAWFYFLENTERLEVWVAAKP
jgi:hypothetical protein